MKRISNLICLGILFIVASCSSARSTVLSGENTIACFEVDAATLLTMVSATTSYRGVKLPNGHEYTFEQVLQLVQGCFGGAPDPTVSALIMALQGQLVTGEE